MQDVRHFFMGSFLCEKREPLYHLVFFFLSLSHSHFVTERTSNMIKRKKKAPEIKLVNLQVSLKMNAKIHNASFCTK